MKQKECISIKLYLIRHGESETNSKKCWTGWLDVNLTKNGIQQAKNVSRFIKDVKFDKVYSSDLKRACQTCENALPSYKYEPLEILREINVGDLQGRTFEYCNSTYGEALEEYKKTGNYAPYGGESVEDFAKRLKGFADIAIKSGAQNIAAFSHGGFLRRFCDHIVGIKTSAKLLPCRNCTIAVFEYRDEKWILHSWINTAE